MTPPEFRGFGELEGAGGAADTGALGKAGERTEGLSEKGGDGAGGVRSWEKMYWAEQRWGGRGRDATPMSINATINERGAGVGGLRRE